MAKKDALAKKTALVSKKTKYQEETGKLPSQASLVNKVMTLTFPQYVDGKIKKKMGLEEACSQVGISLRTYHHWLKQDPSLKEMVDAAKASRMEILKELSINNIEKAVRGELKLRPKEVVDTSFRLLTSTDKEWQPRSQVEVKSVNMNFDLSIEDLQRKILDLSNELNINDK